MKTVLWDWNGTLLDDLDLSFECLNDNLRRFGKPMLGHVDDYRRIFTFPVKEYYARAGLGDDLFEQAAPCWMADYMAREHVCLLRQGAREALEAFRDAGFRQVVLSASKLDNLLFQMERYDILPFFDAVLGLTHIYATSKEGIGAEWMQKNGVNPADCVMIGDTLHDAQVAATLGCRCVLLDGGHQMPDMLATSGWPVAKDVTEAKGIVLDLLKTEK